MEENKPIHVATTRRKEKIEGLGDVVKKVLQKTGIEQVYKKLNPAIVESTEECTPCEKRRRELNESKLSKLIFANNKQE